MLWHLQTKITEEWIIFSAGQHLQYLRRVAESTQVKMKGLCSVLGDIEVQECSKHEDLLLGPSPHPKSLMCLLQAQGSVSQQARCFPQPHCLLSPSSLITCTVRDSLQRSSSRSASYRAHFRERRSERFSQKSALCFWWWQHLPRGLQQPNMRIFWIILIDSLVGWTNLFCKCSH